MKIIKLAEFLAMPEGTIYAQYEPCIFRELQIKHNTLDDTCWHHSPLINIDADNTDDYCDKLERRGESIDLDLEGWMRQSEYDPEELFAVFEKKDLEQWIEVFKNANA